MINDRAPQTVMSSRPRAVDSPVTHLLKNTYMLLALTLVFSAAMSYVSALMNVGQVSPWMFLLGALGLQLMINLTADSALGILFTFLFAGFMGFTTGPFLNYVISTLNNGSELIMISAGGTGLVFFGLSGYILTTKKDMSYLASTIVAGSMVTFVAMIVALVFHITAMQLALCVLFILLSSGMIVYQTSAIVHGGETNYVLATVTLYLSIYNIFMTLLQLLVSFTGQR